MHPIFASFLTNLEAALLETPSFPARDVRFRYGFSPIQASVWISEGHFLATFSRASDRRGSWPKWSFGRCSLAQGAGPQTDRFLCDSRTRRVSDREHGSGKVHFQPSPSPSSRRPANRKPCPSAVKTPRNKRSPNTLHSRPSKAVAVAKARS